MEQPWYVSSLLVLLSDDAPRALNYNLGAFSRDIATIERRLACEGESFLLKTLPKLGASIDLALQGNSPLVCAAFKKRGRSALPAFLSGLLRRVFLDTGMVRSNPCTLSIALLRQVCFWYKKVEKGFTDAVSQSAVAEFIEVDSALPTVLPTGGDIGRQLLYAQRLVVWILRKIGDPSQANPRHGPGAVSGGEGVVWKRALLIKYKQLEEVFRPIPWFRSLRDASENYQCVTDRLVEEYGLDRLALVEKDSGGPRLIGLPPAEYMWCQKALQELLYTFIENVSPVRGKINFTDQEVNRMLTCQPEKYETLDMSKASDRVAYALAEYLFGKTRIWPWLKASRTPGIILPGADKYASNQRLEKDRVMMYKKFAPMGSAVCFPVEALTFFALAVSAQVHAGMSPLMAIRNTFVYGDDIITLRDQKKHLDPLFEAVGLQFNARKCCTSGLFRESCGRDSFDGLDVTPLRMRASTADTASNINRIIQHHNNLFDAGYWSAAAAYRAAALRTYPILRRKYRFPQSERADLPILTWRCHAKESTVRYRYNRETCLTTVKGWVCVSKEEACDPVLEAMCYRESLSRGGPVGRLRNIVTGPGKSDRYVERSLELQHTSVLLKKKFNVVV